MFPASELFIFLLVKKIMKCIICGADLEDEEAEICETCYEVLKAKYPKKKELEEVLQWHKNHTKLNQEC